MGKFAPVSTIQRSWVPLRLRTVEGTIFFEMRGRVSSEPGASRSLKASAGWVLDGALGVFLWG